MSNSEQQFGPWIHASQYNTAKKNVVEVQGYGQNRKTETREKAMNQGWRITADTGQNALGTVAENNETSVSTAVVSNKSITVFEAQLQEIDKAIHGDGGS